MQQIVTFAQFTQSVRNAGVTLVHFAAGWCEPCLQMDAVIHACDESASLQVFKVEAEELVEASEQYEIVAVPTFLFFQAGGLIDRVEGANAAALVAAIRKHSKRPRASAAPAVPLDERLRALVQSSNVMAFLSGTPANPTCGFTKKLVKLLDSTSIPYSSFDVDSDLEVLEGMKRFANWPTYPMVFVQGRLVGGYDVCQELADAGELEATLAPATPEVGGSAAAASLNERLHGLINRAPVMAFIVGTPTAPQCGFSKKLVKLFADEGIAYEWFDVETDQAVLEGLKKFSNWPTYPQVYARGKLVGGCDICHELAEAGELRDALLGGV